MTAKLENQREKKISKAMQALERARALDRSRRDFGVDGICHHVKDVDGDWLENWSDSTSISLNPEIRSCATTTCSR